MRHVFAKQREQIAIVLQDAKQHVVSRRYHDIRPLQLERSGCSEVDPCLKRSLREHRSDCRAHEKCCRKRDSFHCHCVVTSYLEMRSPRNRISRGTRFTHAKTAPLAREDRCVTPMVQAKGFRTTLLMHAH